MKGKVCLLEDDESICELVSCALQMNNIDFTSFNFIPPFLAYLENDEPDIILLDIMLQDGNGLDVLKIVKDKYPKIICIIVSALGKELDKVKGLNLGADDYIAKPFGILELTAKINAFLRRISIEKNAIIKIGNISIDSDKMQVLIDDRRIIINNKEFFLLKYLMENVNIVLSRENIMKNVWGYDFGETRTLDNYVLHLRKEGVSNIETVFGIGYRMIG